MKQTLKPLAITMGDPSGIGPEIVVKSLAKERGESKYIVFGSPAIISRAVAITGVDMHVKTLSCLCEATFDANTIEVYPTSDNNELTPIAEVNAPAGKAAYDAIISAINSALLGEVSGIVTAPINKEALSVAGIHYPGHTEILAEFSGEERVAMMLGNDDIRTVLVTIHCSLLDAIKGADYQAQMSAIRLAHQGASALGFNNPRVAVAGLNPHAGEAGLFGREEIDIISPAIEAARKEGINVSGPWPGDTVFMQAREGQFDIVVAQYHDQGLIPVKYMGLEKVSI